MLKVWGCLCYAYIVKKEKRKGKFAEVSYLGIHMGRTAHTADAYDVLSLKTGRIRSTRNIFFDEHNLSLRLTAREKQLMTKIFKVRTDVSLPDDDEARKNPLTFDVSTRSRTHRKTLTVLEALQCHISLHYSLTGMHSELGDEHDVEYTSPGQPAYVEEEIRDLASIESPTRSATSRADKAKENPAYNNDDVLHANRDRLKSIQSAYIKKRVKKLDGKTIKEALESKVPGKGSRPVSYRAADLRWDLQHDYLTVETQSSSSDYQTTLALLRTTDVDAPLHVNISTLTSQFSRSRPRSEAQAAALKQLSQIATASATKDEPPVTTAVAPLGKCPKSEKDLCSFPEPYRSMWELAIAEEQLAQLKSNSFDYIPADAARNAMTRKPQPLVRVWKEKHLPNDEHGNARLERMKVRDAYNGAGQQEGRDYTPVPSPTMTGFSHKLLHVLARLHGWASTSFDVPSAYLKAPLHEPIIAYPASKTFLYRDKRGVPYVHLYRSGVYGGKNCAGLWHKEMQNYLESIGFISLVNLESVFLYQQGTEMIILGLYVDDAESFYNSAHLAKWFQTKMKTVFNVKFLGRVQWFLGQ